ncbi:hypothetical protein GFY24_38780 [Nocardia sp. SYP-A9097]|uniref:hypothetical protein n=1 Tax=Nocardia sp. SYP-A9097 TaxID=2663237 RepID=UPI00129AA667|nr:hypothetical protein [Nocardia sp. SYP-A9097]MRH93297.1 hypothetical protein [Nocardia sp. SYP-A9097]
MGSWLEELGRREADARERAQGLRERIAELGEQLALEERLVSRLQVTRETMIEILGATGDLDERVESGGAGGVSPGPEFGSGSPIGVVLVPQRGPGMEVSVLPEDYQDVVEVLADAGRPLRAGHIAAALGLEIAPAKVEGLRSKLKRLVARGWLNEQTPGLFTIIE